MNIKINAITNYYVNIFIIMSILNVSIMYQKDTTVTVLMSKQLINAKIIVKLVQKEEMMKIIIVKLVKKKELNTLILEIVEKLVKMEILQIQIQF